MKASVKASVVVMLALASLYESHTLQLHGHTLTFHSASTATIIRLKYLTLYSDPGEFMFSTGKIGLWSLIEEGIGLIAGSLPALRPLLSLRIRVYAGSNTPASGGRAYPSGSHHIQPSARSRGIVMDTFQTLGDHDDGEADQSDGDSQKNIIKETKFTVTSTVAGTKGDGMP